MPALLLAVVGIYGVMSYSVERRTHEVGIRLALGAHTSAVLRLVVKQGMRLAAVGVVIGMVAALMTGQAAHQLFRALFGVKATDPATFALIALLLLLVALLACWIPARRATELDPMTALRWE